MNKFNNGIFFREIKHVSVFLLRGFETIIFRNNSPRYLTNRIELRRRFHGAGFTFHMPRLRALLRIADEIHSLSANARLSIRGAFSLRSSKTRSIRREEAPIGFLPRPLR